MIDIVERFQLSLMLFAIAIRNLIELSASEEDLWTKDAVLPKAFNLGRGSNLLWTTFSVRACIFWTSLSFRLRLCGYPPVTLQSILLFMVRLLNNSMLGSIPQCIKLYSFFSFFICSPVMHSPVYASTLHPRAGGLPEPSPSCYLYPFLSPELLSLVPFFPRASEIAY